MRGPDGWQPAIIVVGYLSAFLRDDISVADLPRLAGHLDHPLGVGGRVECGIWSELDDLRTAVWVMLDVRE